MTPPQATNPTRTGWRTRKRLRRVVGVLVVLVGVWWLGTRGFPARWGVQSVIQGRTGLEVRASSVAINLDGSVDLYDVWVVAPDVQGPAARVVEFGRLHAEIDWSRAFSGGPRISMLVGDGVVARLSQAVDDGSLNSSSLTIKRQSGGRSTLPSILISSGRLEIGEHKGDAYTVLKAIPVRGGFQPSGKPDVYSISLDESAREDGKSPGAELVRVTGTLAPDTLEMELTGLELNEWQPASAPSPLRSFIRGLQVDGRVSRATLRYDRDESIAPRDAISAALYLDDVGLSLPVEPPEPDPSDEPDEIAARLPPTGPLRMTKVSGELRYQGGGFTADLRGLLEEFPYKVMLDYKGLSATAPFECTLISEGFVLGKHPQLFRFAKPIVASRLNLFSEPTGIVDTEVKIERGQPAGGVADEVKVSGVMRFRETRAAFKRFPYEFRDMTGVVRFTDREVVLENVRGTAPSGATLVASGRIAPLTAEAGVDLDIVVRAVPIDDVLIAAMGPVRRRVIDRLMDKERYAALVSAGLVNAPGRPSFELGGKGNVDIKIARKPGIERLWSESIGVTLPRMGLLPQAFPVPVVARDVRVLVQDDAMSVSGGSYELASGGGAGVRATANFGSWSDPNATFAPDIHVDVFGAVLDPLLIQALPGPRADGSDELRRALREMSVSGTIDAKAHLALPGKAVFADGTVAVAASWLAPDDTAFAVDLTLKGGRSGPAGAGVSLENITGDMRVSDVRVDLHLLADVATSALPESGSVLASGHVDLTRTSMEAPTTMTGTLAITATGLDTAAPVEQIVRIIAPSAAEELRGLRAAYAPAGRADVLTTISGSFDEKARVVVDLLGADELQFNTPQWIAGSETAVGLPRVSVGPMRGVARSIIEPGRPSDFEFKDFEAMLRCDGAGAGELRLSGDDVAMSVRWVDAPFQSPLVRALASGRLGSAVETAIRERNPRGVFGLVLDLKRPEIGAAWNVTGAFLPTSLAFDAGSDVVSFDRIEGLIEFDPVSGSFQNMRLIAPQWSATTTGTWFVPGDGAAALKVEAAITGSSLTPDLRALLPANVQETLTELSLDISGAFALPQLYVEASWERPGSRGPTRAGAAARSAPAEAGAGLRAPEQVLVTGTIGVKGMKAEVGVPVADAEGVMDFRIQRSSARVPMAYQFQCVFDSVRAANVRMTDARMRIESGARDDETFVPILSANCHGGRLAGEFEIRPDGPDRPRRYGGRLELSGVRLNPMIDDITSSMVKAGAAGGTVDAGQTLAAAPQEGAAPQGSGGAVVDAGLTLGGLVGDGSSRRGRGFANVGGGRVLSLPVLLPLIQVSNLQVPTGQQLNLAQASFYLQGPTVYFEELSVFADTVEILGFGTLSWPELKLDLLFNSRSQGRVPLVSWLLEGVRNELVTTSVGGTLGAPQVSVRQFRDTRAFLGRVFGAQPSSQEAIMERLERQTPRGSDRIRVNPSSARDR